jgi:hypothetical protein
MHGLSCQGLWVSPAMVMGPSSQASPAHSHTASPLSLALAMALSCWQGIVNLGGGLVAGMIG